MPTHGGPNPARASNGLTLALTAIAILAVLGGIAARFKGLGSWPLAWDEYYLAQSIQFVLHTGLPQYPCGGLYSRGLLVQYGAALLQLAGLSPELAPRLIAALCSLAALLAAFRIARRCGGLQAALLTVTVLALSVWEVEIARFGRMYAPFQAVFLWYVVFFLEYVLDRRRQALVPMLALSVVGVLVWEGGALLALANFLPPFLSGSGRLTRRDLGYLCGVAALFIPLYWFATADLRVMGTAPTLPADYQEPPEVPLSLLDDALPPWRVLPHHRIWLLVALVPLALLVRAAQWLLRFRQRPLALAALVMALGAVGLHQFFLCGALIVLALLVRLVEPQSLWKGAAPFHLAILASLVFWSAFALTIPDWHVPEATLGHELVLLVHVFAGFPDFVRQIALPWEHATPVLGAALVLLLAVAIVRTLGRDSWGPERALLILLVALLLAASAASTPRHETRYVFFLYPLALIVAITTVQEIVTLAGRAWAGAATAVICLGGFALTEDFKPLHLLHVDSAQVSFRQGMSSAEASQYPPRADLSGAARWLREHVEPGTDLVVNSFPGVDFYYPQADFFFMESSDPRFESWSCHAGQVERWSNRPLLYSIPMLDSAARAHPRVWLVVESPRRKDILSRLTSTDPAIRYRVEWVGRNPGICIVSLQRTPDPAT